MFIFLICFFFISFVCTVRWCNNRVRPRRETRGVSRSKCGDLITACVPVSWAASIIVNESTDATDLNDGFGTAELVVGVRAYQWGWEYYYPRTIDLNYNVRPSYSTFVGNSLKYNFSSGKNLTSNTLWRLYQNKTDDKVLTPAHLLLLPLDSSNLINYLNFKDVGINTLSESNAFSKIRNATKIYNSHLVHTPSSLSSKYQKINSAYISENSFLTTSSFGVKKQHNNLSLLATGNSASTTVLDSNSFNKFLNAASLDDTTPNLQANRIQASPLSLQVKTSKTSADATRASVLLNQVSAPTQLASLKILNYPASLESINDNSDKSGLSTPLAKLTSTGLNESIVYNPDLVFTKSVLDTTNSPVTSYVGLTRDNLTISTKEFNLNGPNSKVLANDQSIRNFPNLTPNKSNFNFSPKLNTVASNLSLNSKLNKSWTPSTLVNSNNSGQVDYTLFNKLASSRSFLQSSHPSVLSSNNLESNSLAYDRSAPVTSTKVANLWSYTNFLEQSKASTNAVGDVFVGSREKTPQAINSAYWTSFWSTTEPSHRVNSALRANFERSQFYIPYFSTYSDYDFRNDQAIDMLEELFWESNISGYNFYDYMTINKDVKKNQLTSPKDFGLEKPFYQTVLGNELQVRPLTVTAVKDISIVGNFYANSIQLEDSLNSPSTLSSNNFALLPTTAEMNDVDESFANYKMFSALFNKVTALRLATSSVALSPRSYISVFNHFRSDYEDFNWTRIQPNLLKSNFEMSDKNLISALPWVSENFDGSQPALDLRVSNLATLRPSVRNSIVSYNAFQKVFKPRLDESRAHVNSHSFSELGLRQPFLSDTKVPYLQLLGKNRDSFFSTPLYTTLTHKNFNTASSLMESLNTPMYDFPFLLAKTSDTARFTWIDWFSKWKHIEVQPSSVSKYSTLGVPYLRKPFDFNSTTGDKFQDTELYFTRVARSRRNYLTNWSYSPYLYNRSYLWNTLSSLQIKTLSLNGSGSLAKLVSKSISRNPLHDSLLLENNSLTTLNYSLSGNDIYGKSTWQPRSSIASYYYNTSKLIDILAKREMLYRQYFFNSFAVQSLPKHLCATPINPLLLELKSSFQFTDPIHYSSEYSRDLFYTTAYYVKFTYLKTLAESASRLISTLPLNTSLLTNYTFFYFFGSESTNLGQNQELFKDQFRPLKKGISSMLRLHATGAVAMPIEIRLQVLASSRDVIHSWAIPSASIKIDCVPGYTSHRMMKFLLTGVYWGQCQEICGRYHHWMPIVVYFMKRDLFFLWCTHFVFTPTPNQVWDISDRKFADLIRFASYDKSSWLNEFNYN